MNYTQNEKIMPTEKALAAGIDIVKLSTMPDPLITGN